MELGQRTLKKNEIFILNEIKKFQEMCSQVYASTNCLYTFHAGFTVDPKIGVN